MAIAGFKHTERILAGCCGHPQLTGVISPYFGYNIRSTLAKHGLLPSGWTNDATYASALKSGFNVNGVGIPGTDASSFATFYQFVTNMVAVLNANGLPQVADEFQTMRISYPFTIRKYCGNPSNAGGGGGGAGVTLIAPTSGIRGQSYNVTITIQALPGTPGLPPANAPISTATVGGIGLASPVRSSTTTVSGTLNISSGATTGLKDVAVSFAGPPGPAGAELHRDWSLPLLVAAHPSCQPRPTIAGTTVSRPLRGAVGRLEWWRNE